MDLPAVLYYQVVSVLWGGDVWRCGGGWGEGVWVGVGVHCEFIYTLLFGHLRQLSIPVVEFESKKCFRCIFVNRKLREEVCWCITLPS